MREPELDATSYLPERFIFKENKDREQERIVYEKLSSLQGKVIPNYYCSANIYGFSGKEWVNGIVLERISGNPLSDVLKHEDLRQIAEEQWKDMISAAVDKLSERGVVHTTLSTDSILIRTEGRGVMLVDFRDVIPEDRTQVEVWIRNSRAKTNLFKSLGWTTAPLPAGAPTQTSAVASNIPIPGILVVSPSPPPGSEAAHEAISRVPSLGAAEGLDESDSPDTNSPQTPGDVEV